MDKKLHDSQIKQQDTILRVFMPVAKFSVYADSLYLVLGR